MSNNPASDSMMRLMFIAVLCSATVVGCARKPGEVEQSHQAGDSTHASDSTGQALALQPAKLLSYEENQGAYLYAKYCAVCHGEGGKGDGFNAYNLDSHPRDFTDSTYMKALSDDQIVQTISGGGRSVNKSPLMPAYGWTLSKQEIRYLASYVRSLMNE